MKIAILTSGGVDRGGEQRVIPCLLWLIERLVLDGDEVHVFALYQEPDPGQWALCGATIHNAGANHPARRMFAQVLQEHRRAPFHVIHTSWSLLAHAIGALAGKVLGVPSLVYLGDRELVRAPDIAPAQASLRGRMLLRLALAAADRVATQSSFVVEQARAQGVAAIRLPFGVALDHWPPAPPRPRDPRAAAKLLHVGSLVPVKDHGMLLEAAAGLCAGGVDFELDVIGEDVGGDGAVRRQAVALGLDDRVRFHGFLPHRQTRRFFDEADLLLVTSRHESGPLVLLEAAVAGVPTVGTNVGHLSEWAPRAACVVEPRDGTAMVQAIMDLLSDEDARQALARRAQQTALAEDAEVTSRRFRDLYADMAGKTRRPRSPDAALNRRPGAKHSLPAKSG